MILQNRAIILVGFSLCCQGIQRQQFVYAVDHLYGICQKELLKLLAWQVAADRGVIDVGKTTSTCLSIFAR